MPARFEHVTPRLLHPCPQIFENGRIISFRLSFLLPSLHSICKSHIAFHKLHFTNHKFAKPSDVRCHRDGRNASCLHTLQLQPLTSSTPLLLNHPLTASFSVTPTASIPAQREPAQPVQSSTAQCHKHFATLRGPEDATPKKTPSRNNLFAQSPPTAYALGPVPRDRLDEISSSRISRDRSSVMVGTS